MNEMLLFKVPEDVYQQIMAEFHHHAPNEEEERLRAVLDQIEESTSGAAVSIETDQTDEGFQSMAKKPRLRQFE